MTLHSRPRTLELDTPSTPHSTHHSTPLIHTHTRHFPPPSLVINTHTRHPHPTHRLDTLQSQFPPTLDTHPHLTPPPSPTPHSTSPRLANPKHIFDTPHSLTLDTHPHSTHPTHTHPGPLDTPLTHTQHSLDTTHSLTSPPLATLTHTFDIPTSTYPNSTHAHVRTPSSTKKFGPLGTPGSCRAKKI